MRTATSTWSREYFTALSSKLETAVRNSTGSPRSIMGAAFAEMGSKCRTPGAQMMADAREFDGFADEFGEIQLDVVAFAAAVAGLAGFENLLDGAEQAIGIEQHQIVKLLALRLRPLRGAASFPGTGGWK